MRRAGSGAANAGVGAIRASARAATSPPRVHRFISFSSGTQANRRAFGKRRHGFIATQVAQHGAAFFATVLLLTMLISLWVSELTKIFEGLSALLPPDRVLTADEDLIPYSFDGTAALSQRPVAVALATTTDEVSRVLKWANATRTPIVARGSGTGLAGGCIPTPGCVVLGLARFDKILELDRRNLTLLAEPGVATQSIYDLADGAGLLYPPDPGSMKSPPSAAMSPAIQAACVA